VGFDHHLVKPIDSAELLALMRHPRRASGAVSGDSAQTR
jgi:DNA-binding response OmpR family regulator